MKIENHLIEIWPSNDGADVLHIVKGNGQNRTIILPKPLTKGQISKIEEHNQKHQVGTGQSTNGTQNQG